VLSGGSGGASPRGWRRPRSSLPLIYLVSHQLQASYTSSIAITLAIPLGFSLLTLPLWAAYLDRVHISEFRARHSWVWVLAQAVTWFGAIRGSLLWIGLGRVLLGMGRGGGALAWQLHRRVSGQLGSSSSLRTRPENEDEAGG
jgi:hypothetical protein